MVKGLLVVLAIVIGTERMLELRLAGRNRRLILARGGQECGQSHYRWVILLHSAWFVAWLAEAFARGPHLPGLWPVWLALFLLAEALRYWCITTLGVRWNTRILVIPGAPLVRSGPYRWLRHPNYLAVVTDLFAVPMIFNAWITALAFTVLNLALLLFVRIPAEEKALKRAQEPQGNPKEVGCGS
ncbi:MAG: isoprenylcysteine carboxyl methyltransferase family protein [Acidobacteriota bacterium]